MQTERGAVDAELLQLTQHAIARQQNDLNSIRLLATVLVAGMLALFVPAASDASDPTFWRVVSCVLGVASTGIGIARPFFLTELYDFDPASCAENAAKQVAAAPTPRSPGTSSEIAVRYVLEVGIATYEENENFLTEAWTWLKVQVVLAVIATAVAVGLILHSKG